MTTVNLNIDFKLSRNASGELQFTDRLGHVHNGAIPVRAFPISAPDDGVSIVSKEGHELAWVSRLSDLPSPIKALIEAELTRREFMPVIHHINQVSSFATPSVWDVETDKGSTQLTLKAEDQIWRLKNNKLLITDKNGVNFMIEALDKLDRHSRKLLDRFL